MKNSILIILLSMSLLACNPSNGEGEVKQVEAETTFGDSLSDLNLPDGFEIAVYADDVPNARSMAMSSGGVLYIGTRNEGKVYAVKDSDGDNVAEQKYVLAKDLKMPNGVAYRDGSLYVAEISRLTRFDNIDNQLENPGQGVEIYDDYPTDQHHGWKYIAFGPDGKLYVPVGAPCNICESKDERFASITRMNADGSDREIFASGVRNTVGFTWDSEGNMWFTDNGRDLLGDNMPPCELNKATKAGNHYGYPYCHGGDIADPEFGSKYPCSDFEAPARKLGPHVAPLGLKFYTGDMFPPEYNGSLIIAEHGSWNRSRKIGYRLMQVKVENGRAVSYDVFVDGWLDEKAQEAWGRPVDVLVMKDGSILVSDDKAGKIYRISYKGA
ncbi:PQQ-dependent sugar dehydrogenase [Reichenbachiella ulvae]|uniref:PQQ-dependent sugar dehydrogenase n=1 Tax=Reichenbachiella ulvae TaxID=2980104 RepID=A0ABT3CT62_9BACT|nr:PQQ-dependent sugar dehydrogenase [Reichenbachiella ulvae]MCV9386819.1 PQQ-dependent sugar dehydrogenase [Reichenbachiella ulvae]